MSQPNVLSDAAQPNRLSTQTGRPAKVLTGRPNAPQRANVTPTTVARATSASQFERPSRPLPSVSTLIFFGFVGLTIFRCATRS